MVEAKVQMHLQLKLLRSNKGVPGMIRKIAIGSIFAALAMSSVTFADQPTPPPGNSANGIERYLANPGRQQAIAVGAQCGSGAGSGAFGFFGKDNNLAGGANGPATGQANSSVCGNGGGGGGNLP
jgi:hypothetical protein